MRAGALQAIGEQADGEQGEMIGNGALADEDALLRQRGVGLAANGHESLDGMGERVGAGHGRQARRAGQRQFGIADRHLRDEMRARNADLERAVRVGQHGNGGDFGTGAGGGGHGDDGQDRAGNLELAIIVLRGAAMAQQQGDAFGQVQAGAAADPDNHVGRKRLGRGSGGKSGGRGHIGLHGGIHLHGQALCREQSEHLGKGRIGREPRIGADQDALAIPLRDHAQSSCAGLRRTEFPVASEGRQTGSWQASWRYEGEVLVGTMARHGMKKDKLEAAGAIGIVARSAVSTHPIDPLDLKIKSYRISY